MYTDSRGKVWYPSFKKNDEFGDKSAYLLRDFPRQTLGTKLVVQVVTHRDEHKYSTFDNHIDLYKYEEKLSIEQRTFFETILGEYPQKIKFDLDINPRYKEEVILTDDELRLQATLESARRHIELTESLSHDKAFEDKDKVVEGDVTKSDVVEDKVTESTDIESDIIGSTTGDVIEDKVIEDKIKSTDSDDKVINLDHLRNHEDIKDDLILSILKVFNDYNIEFELDKDILVFTSHSAETDLSDPSTNLKKVKRSYHIVVDNYFHENNLEAQAFCHLVVAKMKEEYKTYVDTSVYKPMQQFRIYGNQKRGSKRPKIFCDTWYLCGNKVEHILPKFSNDTEKEIYILGISLIGNCRGCKPLPIFRPTYQLLLDAKRQESITYDTEDLNETLAKRAMIVLAASAGLTIYDPIFPYKLRKINGNLLDLRRTRPSRCKICARIHENENPFLIVRNGNAVYYGCRRANNRTIHVGDIITEDFIKEPEVRYDDDPVSTEPTLTGALIYPHNVCIFEDTDKSISSSSSTETSPTLSSLSLSTSTEISSTPIELSSLTLSTSISTPTLPSIFTPTKINTSDIDDRLSKPKVKRIKVKLDTQIKSELLNNFSKNKESVPGELWYLSQRLSKIDLSKLKL